LAGRPGRATYEDHRAATTWGGVQAHDRRGELHTAVPLDPQDRLDLVHGTVDLNARRFLPSDGGPEVPLTQRDVDLLRYLARHSERRVDRDELVREIWADQPGVQARVVETAIHRLRTKIEPIPTEPRALLGGAGDGVRLLVATAPSDGLPELPRWSGNVLGREALLQKLDELLVGGASLVTLVGDDGIGKTRLCVELCRRVDDPVYFVNVASVRTEDGLRHAVAAALGVRLGGADEDAPMVSALAGALLVLDQVDGALDAAAVLLPAWLLSPGVRVLATSTQPLLVSSEEVVEVGPLGSAFAMRLFVERAEGGGRRPADEPAAIQALVARLGGNPLAIELAAGWSPVLDTDKLLQRVEESAQPGEDPLTTMVRGSFTLLTADEQEVLFAAALFSGAFDQDSLASLAESSARVPASVLALRRHGLLVEIESPRKRFLLPEVVRRFVEEERRRRAGKPELVQRFAEYCLAQAETLAERCADGSPSQRLDRELGALVADAERIDDPELAARLVYALGPALDVAGWLRVHLALVERSLAAEPSAPLRAGLLQRRGSLLLALGAFDAAEQAISAAARVIEGLGDVVLRAEVALDRAALAGARGQGDGVVAGTRLAADRLRAAQDVDPLRAASVWSAVGANLLAASDHAGALAAYEEAVRFAREAGSHRRAATAFTRLAYLALHAGQLPETSARVGEAEAELRVIGARAPPALMRVRCALAELRGDYPLAEGEARDLSNVAGLQAHEPWTQHEARLALARCAIRRDELTEAWGFAAAAASFARERWMAGWIEATVLLAIIYLRQGMRIEALRIREALAAARSGEAVDFVDALLRGESPGPVPEGAALGTRLRYALVSY
jgi:tetratricopeptide (TPR) repeat protein